MIRIRSKNVLLVAADTFLVELTRNNKIFRHISSVSSVFPAIHELKPNMIILDFEYLGVDLEKILRRLSSNAFYEKIKICCYKPKSHTKVDALLKALGVDYFIFEDELKETESGKGVLEVFGGMFDMPGINWVARHAH